MSTFFGICAIIIGVVGLIVAILNLLINDSNRRMNSYRLAFDLRNYRENMARENETNTNTTFVIVLLNYEHVGWR